MAAAPSNPPATPASSPAPASTTTTPSVSAVPPKPPKPPKASAINDLLKGSNPALVLGVGLVAGLFYGFCLAAGHMTGSHWFIQVPVVLVVTAVTAVAIVTSSWLTSRSYNKGWHLNLVATPALAVLLLVPWKQATLILGVIVTLLLLGAGLYADYRAAQKR